MLFEPFCLQTQNGYKPFLSALQTWRKKEVRPYAGRS